MKIILMVLILFSEIYAQIIEQKKISNFDLNSVWFADDSIGFIACSAGRILKTTDAGENWEEIILDITDFNDVFFLDKNTGWVVGEDNLLFKTTNCGESWIAIQSNYFSYTLSCVYFSDSSKGWISTYDPIIGFPNGVYFSSNGGFTWDKQLDGWFDDFFFIDSIGFCIDFDGIVWRTSDYGFNWTQYQCGNFLTSVYFPDSLTGYVLAGSPWLTKHIYKTSDSGLTWNTVLEKTDNSALNCLWFFNSQEGVVCGISDNNKGTILQTTNGGDVWMEIDTLENAIKDICFISDTIGWGVGWGGYITKLYYPLITGFSETPVSKVSDLLTLHVYPNPSNNQTIINYYLSDKGNVKLVLYNSLGEKVSVVHDEYELAGEYSITFRSEDLASGMYYLLLEQGDNAITHKIIILK